MEIYKNQRDARRQTEITVICLLFIKVNLCIIATDALVLNIWPVFKETKFIRPVVDS